MTDPNPDPPAASTSALDLFARYPACFDRANPRPLKRRIHKDLMAAGYLRKDAKRPLAAYCSRRAYLNAMLAGAPRIDLDGQPAGEVTEDEAALANAMLTGALPIRQPRTERPKAPLSPPRPRSPKTPH